MAIFLPHIKGAVLDNGALKYTYIDFKPNALPHIYLNNKTDADSDKGAIVTTNNVNTFSQNNNFNLITFLHSNASHQYSTTCGFDVEGSLVDKFVLKYHQDSTSYNIFSVGNDGASNIVLKMLTYLYGTLIETDVINLKQRLNCSSASYIRFGDARQPEAGGISILETYYGKNLTVTGTCSAGFFNVTSDKRAKTDISYLNINALDLINQVRIYSFNYKDTNEPSIGVIAQELQDINLQGFKLVDNINASGEDGDYMRVKESKLVYILWQGIQELTEEVKQLKDEINTLKNKKD